jgi:hypothetical protein
LSPCLLGFPIFLSGTLASDLGRLGADFAAGLVAPYSIDEYSAVVTCMKGDESSPLRANPETTLSHSNMDQSLRSCLPLFGGVDADVVNASCGCTIVKYDIRGAF